MRFPVLAIIPSIALLSLFFFSGISAANGCCLFDPEPPGLLWEGEIEITENLTVEAGEELVISAGVNVTLGRDVVITVNGTLRCGSENGRRVIIESREERLSGGLVLLNCRQAIFHNTEFRGLAVALETVYSDVEFEGCVFNDTGNGILSFESDVIVEGTSFMYCDMAARLVRSEVELANCTFGECVQSVVAHSDISRIGTYWWNEISDLRKEYDPIGMQGSYSLSVSGCGYHSTGIGISAFDLAQLTISDTEFTECKKGLDVVASPGNVRKCLFFGNKVDYEVTGDGLELSENVSSPINYSTFAIYRIRLVDEEGNGAPGARVTLSHEGIANATYVTDEEGFAKNITLLALRAENGVEKRYGDYRVTTDDQRFVGYHLLGTERNMELAPEDFSDDDEEIPSVGKEVCLGMLGVLLVLGIIGFVRKRGKGAES